MIVKSSDWAREFTRTEILSSPELKALIISNEDLLKNYKKLEKDLQDIRIQMARLHNNETDVNTLRCELLRLGAEIKYQFEARNWWNMSPCIELNEKALSNFQAKFGSPMDCTCSGTA